MSESSNVSSIWDIDIKSANGLKDLEVFLSQGGNPNEVRYVNTDYLHTFIGDAAYSRNIEAIELLAQYGTDVDLGGGELGSSGSALLTASELGVV